MYELKVPVLVSMHSCCHHCSAVRGDGCLVEQCQTMMGGILRLGYSFERLVRCNRSEYDLLDLKVGLWAFEHLVSM